MMTRKDSRLWSITFLLMACMISGPGLVGCQKKLFPEKNVRTQFETHDRLRQSSTPTQEPDVFGNPQPALRARLGPQG